MSDETVNESAEERDDKEPENTPAGSYRVAGNDVSGYLGVDPEYMNYADETQKPSLTEDEQFLFLPAPTEETDEVGEEESSSEELDLADDDAESHDDDTERQTYVEPTGGSEGDDKQDGDKKGGERAPRPAL